MPTKEIIAQRAAALSLTLPPSLQSSMDVSSDKGASHWLTALPLTAHGFALPKASFRDAMPFVCATIGNPTTFLFTARAANHLQSTTLYRAPQVGIQCFATMSCEI